MVFVKRRNLVIPRETILLIIIELTVPREWRMDEAYERKKLKYSELCDD